MFFIIIRLKRFHYSQNTAVILAPGHEFFFAKSVQFSLTFTE